MGYCANISLIAAIFLTRRCCPAKLNESISSPENSLRHLMTLSFLGKFSSSQPPMAATKQWRPTTFLAIIHDLSWSERKNLCIATLSRTI
jgi:hypothetical protein